MKVSRCLHCMVTLSLLLLLLSAACGKVRYPTSYVLDFPRPTMQPAMQKSRGIIHVTEFRCPEYLCRDRIVYRPGPEEVGFYEFHRWAMDPRRSVTRFVADTIAAQLHFITAVYEKQADADYIMTGEIERLEEIDRDRDVFVECAISAELLQTRTRSIVWRDRVAKTVPVDEREVRGVVRSLTTAAQMVIDDLVGSMAKALP